MGPGLGCRFSDPAGVRRASCRSGLAPGYARTDPARVPLALALLACVFRSDRPPPVPCPRGKWAGPDLGAMKCLNAEKNKKTKKNKENLVDNKNIVCYIVSTHNRGGTEMRKTAGEIARETLVAAGISQKKLADKMGLKSQQALFSMLNAKNGMRVDNFVKIMDTLGFEVIVRNKVTDSEQLVSAEGSETE